MVYLSNTAFHKCVPKEGHIYPKFFTGMGGCSHKSRTVKTGVATKHRVFFFKQQHSLPYLI